MKNQGKMKMKKEAVDQNQENWLSEFLDDGSVESHKYYVARRTMLEMLKDRGYAVPNSEIEISLQQFRDKHGQNPDINSLRISVLHKDNPSIKVVALFCSPGIVKVSVIRPLASMIVIDSLSRLILIVQNKVTTEALKSLDLFPFKVEIFQINDLLVNITKNEMMPKHKVLSDEEKKDLLEKYKIDEKLVPRMSEKDAIARYYRLEKGQIVKTTYSGELTQLYVTYRCVC
ncbi:hypothetical protein RD792_008152 [Penstemon davidsonii]|uniref:Uncharacterized protein n=1 Tax=Penstemon davidsonii TaxID=160366 RepID=A0ABR0D8F3_9LAMI|nr:hypothetical protein RD792_008152 [Penstemon davidsonii]